MVRTTDRRRPWLAVAVTTAVLASAGTAVTAAQAATGCQVSYSVSSQWQGGFGASVDVTNLGSPITSWQLTWSFDAGQSISQLWNGSYAQSGAQVTVSNASYNGSLATGASTNFGFNGAWNNSANPIPTDFALNGVTCTGVVSSPSASATPSVSASASASASPSSSASASPSPSPSSSGTGDAGITASVDGNGGYQIQATQPAAWTFSGSVGHPITSQSIVNGSDAIGAYREIDFSYTDSVARSASIRVYQNTPDVLFSSTTKSSAANSSSAGTPFPSISTPTLAYRESFQDGPWSPYQFGGTPAHDSPQFAFDAQGHSFMISPADNFGVANLTRSSGGTVSAGIISGVSTLPAGFTHRTLLTLGNGVNTTYSAWGSALMALGGKKPIPNDANNTLNKLGYWTDNGATYYYSYNTSLGYQGTLEAVAKDFASKGIPLGYLQLDSWWYPKGSADAWTPNSGGEYLYQAAPALFPNSLVAFQQQLGLPLITHARWIDSSSPYRSQYTISNNVSTDPRFWDSVMSYLNNSGVVTYEQDWLSAQAQPNYNLNDPNAFMGGMANSAATRGITLQYCMALPWNNLQSTLYQNAQTTRVALDRFDRTKWDNFLFDSRFASAVGMWPWTDVFMSTETQNLLLSTLSGGMVGVGDPIGKESTSNLLQSVRSDGVIVKPDTAIVPLDGTYAAVAGNSTAPMVAAAYTDHSGLRDGYVFAYSRNNASQSITFKPSSLGVNGAAYVYNYFTGSGTLVPAGGSFTDTVGTNGSYYVVAPVGQSGIAFLGDAGKFVSTGDKRIASLSDNGTVNATVAFASTEHTVTVHGYAPSAPTVTATDGSVGTVTYNSSTHLFSVTVNAGSDHNAVIALH